MASVLHRSRSDDAELARRVGSGDGAAFATLDARHRTALIRYARTLLRRSEHDAEDVVQDVLIRAHDVLRAGDAPDELQPWLYRLTRNRAIDEVRRKRWGDAALDSEALATADGHEDPEIVLRRKETVRRLVEDLAALPVSQRTALLARELDDQSPEQVAAQLGVSVTAAQNLATRARANLIKTRDARDADCPDIRAAVLDAHERGVRPSEHALRHVRGCDACRAHKRDVGRLSKQLHGLSPAFGLSLLAGAVKLVGGGGAKVAAGAAAAATVAVVATGGIVVIDSGVHSPGDPAPFKLLSTRDSKGRPVTRGTPIPEGFTIVTARIRLPAGPHTRPRTPRGPYAGVTLPCPKGMKLAGYQGPDRELPLRGLGLSNDSILGRSTSGRVNIVHSGLKEPFVFTVGIQCRRPDADGSINLNPRKRRAGERLAHVCPSRNGVILRRSPGGTPQDYLPLGAPVYVQRANASGTWTRVASDRRGATPGWVKTGELCS